MPLRSRTREILAALLEAGGEVVSKKDPFERLWARAFVEEGTLRVHIAALRRALGDRDGSRRYVEAVNGQGYRFIAPVCQTDLPPEPVLRTDAPGIVLIVVDSAGEIVGPSSIAARATAQLALRSLSALEEP